MNGSQIKQAAIQKAKQVANTASNGNANKKRKKELKPIITTEGQQQKDAEGASNMAASNQASAG
jgi:serine/threonine-protein kinase SRPK3